MTLPARRRGPRPGPRRARGRALAAGPGEAALRRRACVHAPGRVNLIGEHTDYNEGFVLPVAIDLGIAIALRADRRPAGRGHARRDRRGARLRPRRDRRRGAAPGSTTSRARRGRWPRPACRCAASGGCWRRTCRRARAVVVGGAGARVGAARCPAATPPAWTGWRSPGSPSGRENEYVGVNCGLMDQFASAFGGAGQRAAARLPDPRAPGGRRCRDRTSRWSSATRARRGGWRRPPTTSGGASARRRSRRSRAPSRA